MHYKKHDPILIIYEDNWKNKRLLGLSFKDTLDKYISWREIGDIVKSRDVDAIFFISEAWIRTEKFPYEMLEKGISNLKIIGETLQVLSLSREVEYKSTAWKINREGNSPKLERLQLQYKKEFPEIFIPIKNSFEAMKKNNTRPF